MLRLPGGSSPAGSLPSCCCAAPALLHVAVWTLPAALLLQHGRTPPAPCPRTHPRPARAPCKHALALSPGPLTLGPAPCSGHGAMRENFFLDDGTYSASQILVEMVKRRLEGHGDLTQELLQELQEPAEAHEFRLKLKVGQ